MGIKLLLIIVYIVFLAPVILRYELKKYYLFKF